MDLKNAIQWPLNEWALLKGGFASIPKNTPPELVGVYEDLKRASLFSAAVPLASGYLATRLLNLNKFLSFYLGGAAGALATPYLLIMIMMIGKDARKQSSTGPHPNIAGPLSAQPLPPINPYNPHPAVPRYPFSTGAMYSLNQELGWRGSRGTRQGPLFQAHIY